jgi:hypothetical protein
MAGGRGIFMWEEGLAREKRGGTSWLVRGRARETGRTGGLESCFCVLFPGQEDAVAGQIP